MDQQYYAHGKILLTSEFMILHGARALAVPLNLGQSLKLQSKGDPGTLHWTAMYNDQSWFKTKIATNTLTVQETTDGSISGNLVHMLKQLLDIKPAFFGQINAFDVITNLEFHPEYGFGSSSTLTHLLSRWAEIDPMQLHFKISRGSGYDVACAGADSPLLYQVVNDMPVSETVEFQPDCMEQIYLVYLGKKQQSGSSVAAFLDHYHPIQADIDYFSGLTSDMLKANSIEELGSVMEAHENRLSSILQTPVLKTLIFPDLNGYVKSLGAWGGDFAMLVTDWDRETISDYLNRKGMSDWYPYRELVL